MKKINFYLMILSIFLIAACGGGNGEESPSSSNASEDSSDNTGAEETYEFELSHAAAETHPFHIGVEKFVELVDEKSDGRIDITVYPARQLGDERENLENIMNGTIDMAVISSPLFSAYTPVFDAFQLPFLLNNYDIEQEAYKLDVTSEMLDSLNELGIKGLTVIEGGMRHIANNEQEIHEPSDLKGLSLRTVESQLILDIFNELGASPTPMAYGEVYTSLETGVIDGEEVNLSTLVAEKHMEVVDHVTITGQFPFPALTVMNEEIFETLSEEDQQLMQEAADEARDYLFKENAKMDEEALQEIKDAGLNVVELEEEELKVFEEEMDAVYDEYMAKDPLIEKFVEEVRNIK